MSTFNLTQQEAEMLINMIKKCINKQDLPFPNSGNGLILNVVGQDEHSEFVINIDRAKINTNKCNYQGRVKSNNIPLLRLDINPSKPHKNPSDHKIIRGSHLHFYTEEYGIRDAVEFETEGKNLAELCLVFFDKFNVVDIPKIVSQGELNLGN